MNSNQFVAALVASAAGLLVAGAVYAADTTTTTNDSAAASQSDEATVECRRIKDVGSNLGKRKVCMTRAEWVRISDESKALDRKLEDGHQYTPSGELIGPVGR